MADDTLISDIPIFPLGSVLFPRMPLSLHIFEERYKAMLRDLPLSDNRFVVALIHEGVEVGGEANPHSVACIAEATHVQPLPQGTYFLRAMGKERVKISALDREAKPYLRGSALLLPDDIAQTDVGVLTRLQRTFREYVQLLADLSSEPLGNFDLPSDPSLLASLVATMLQITPEARQQLLEAPSVAARLEAEAHILRLELPLLRAMVSAPHPPDIGEGHFSAN